MKWSPLAIWLVLLSAWAGLAMWQLNEYKRMRNLAFDDLHRQAETVNWALLGGIRTHRGMGWFFEDMLREALNEVIKSETVLAAAIESGDGKRIAFAGKETLLNADTGAQRKAAVFVFRHKFEMHPPAGRARGGPGPGGRGPGWMMRGRQGNEGAMMAGGTFVSVLLLDSSPTEIRCRREAQLRGLVVAAGCLVLLCMALVWRATVRTAEARGRARLFQSEARHLRDLSQAAAGLAHETRNPLGLIRGWTQRLAQYVEDDPTYRHQSQAIVEECDRVTARINQFLAFARPSDPRIVSVATKDVVDELAVLLEPDIDAKDLTIDRQEIDLNNTVRADREMLRQALFNLVQNAVQFSPKGASIKVVVHTDQHGKKRIEVSDRGPGVPEEAVESLFTPYFTSRADGTGLGLAIVRQIAMVHGWESGYEPRPGGGSIFWLDQIDG